MIITKSSPYEATTLRCRITFIYCDGMNTEETDNWHSNFQRQGGPLLDENKYWFTVYSHRINKELIYNLSGVCYCLKLHRVRIYTSTIAILVHSRLANAICDDPLTSSCPAFRYWFLPDDDALTLTDREPEHNIKVCIILKRDHEGRRGLIGDQTYNHNLSTLCADWPSHKQISYPLEQGLERRKQCFG